MAQRDLILALAKVIIAAAWADNELTPAERNSMKDLLFRLPESYSSGNRRLNSQEWTMLEMYMDSPVDAVERAQLIADLQAALRTPADKTLVLESLENLVRADGIITAEEQRVVAEIQTALDAVDVGFLGQLSRLLQGPMQRRTEAMGRAANREQYFEEFVRNKVYYGVRRKLDQEHVELELSDETLRRLSSIGGLMARVAHVDGQVTDDEFTEMVHMLQSTMNVTHEQALFITEVAVSEVSHELDFLRLTRELAAEITPEEGDRLLHTLFLVAEADGFVSDEEIEEIFKIGYSLNLTHRQFIQAKLTIPAEKRAA
ncbi:MAG: TerB family tellurite resistance protein [Caldilineaceae bacterium]